MMRAPLFNPRIPKKLKTLKQLCAIDDDFQRDGIKSLEPKIQSSEEANHEEAINFLLRGAYGSDVLKMVTASPIIKAFCEKKEYEKDWQERITWLKSNKGIRNFVPATNSGASVFQQMLGLLIAREHNEWDHYRLANHPAAQELYAAVKVFGIRDTDKENSLSPHQPGGTAAAA